MLTAQIVALGLFAGLTIFLGLPIARIRAVPKGLRIFLGSLTAGILIFLLWDVLSQAIAPVNTAAASGDSLTVSVQTVILLGTFLLAFLGLTLFERLFRVQLEAPTDTAPTPAPLPPTRAMTLIAGGIGLHNFGEGLAIGASFAAGQLGVATILFVGFAAHNSTEGFGIVGPALAAGYVPSWRRLGALGLLGGGPTLLGTLVGSLATFPDLTIAFLGAAAGAILYVVIELVQARGKANVAPLRAIGVFAGFAVGLVTDLLVTAGHV